MSFSIQNGAEDVYETFNIIMRRKPKENNFKVSLIKAVGKLYSVYCDESSSQGYMKEYFSNVLF